MLAALGLVACRGGADRPAAPVTLELDTAPGLSDLAVDDDGALWTVAERDRIAYRIRLAGDRLAGLVAFPIDGVPDGVDLEAIAWIDGALAFGTEGDGDTALVLTGTIADGRIRATVAQTIHASADRRSATTTASRACATPASPGSRSRSSATARGSPSSSASPAASASRSR
jgi:hypothetical protein